MISIDSTRINIFTVELILGAKILSILSLGGLPLFFPPSGTDRKFQRNELPALLACTFEGNSVSTVNSRLCDRNQRRSLLLQRLIKTNRCATGAGTRGERSRGVACRIEGRCGRKFVGRSAGGLNRKISNAFSKIVVKCSKNIEFVDILWTDF